MINLWNRFIIVITAVFILLPLASQAEALDSEQLSKRLAELRLEYNRIETEINDLTSFIGKAKDDRASIDTLVNFLFRNSVVAQEIESLSKKADALSLKGSGLSISKMWATDTLKSSEALTAISEGEATYLYITFDMPEKLETVDIAFTVMDLSNGKNVATINWTRPRKGTEISQRTGIKIEADDLQLGTRYEWQAVLTVAGGKTISNDTQFAYGQAVVPLGEITLVASNGETGQPINSNIADDASLIFEATVPLIESGEGEISWQLLDANKKPIESSRKVESFNEVGGNKTSIFKLTSGELSAGQYTVAVTHILKGNSKSRAENTITFNVMGALNIHKLAVSNSKEGDITSGVLKAGDLPHLYIHYTALKPVQTGALRIYDAISGKVYYASDITERVKVDRKKHRIGTRLSAELLPLDREVVFDVSFTDMKGKDIASKRSFRINRHKLKVELAKKLESGKDYTFSITPPSGFVSPYTVAYQPSNLLVHESRNNPLAGSVTGITEQKDQSAGLKIELTDANGQVAVAYRELVIIGSHPQQLTKQPGSTAKQKNSNRDLFSSLWGYKEGDYRKDPLLKLLDKRDALQGNRDYPGRRFIDCLSMWYSETDDLDIDSDRALMAPLPAIRKKIIERQKTCSSGKLNFELSFDLHWYENKPSRATDGYRKFETTYDANCKPLRLEDHGYFSYTEYDDGYAAVISKHFTSNSVDSIIDMMVMSCLAPAKFIKEFIPEAPVSATKPIGCTMAPGQDNDINITYECRKPPVSPLPRKLW